MPSCTWRLHTDLLHIVSDHYSVFWLKQHRKEHDFFVTDDKLLLLFAIFNRSILGYC